MRLLLFHEEKSHLIIYLKLLMPLNGKLIMLTSLLELNLVELIPQKNFNPFK